ncbi:MAG: acyl-CoA dehydrogenase family protein [Candidatus Tectomicrobia bacterium]|nr:acyl-CoA dehydrogenase family protein [Candidatus Tectomicrobia bacterium]
MDFELNEVQRQVQRTLRDFVNKEVIPVAPEYEHKDEYPHPLVERMKEMGIFGFLIGEAYGGSGMDYVSYALMMEELARGWMSLCGVIGSHGMTGWIIEHFGTEAQKRKFLPDLAKGVRRAGMALTEPEAGSDAASLKTSARRAGDAYIVNGTKMFITNSEMGTTFSVFVRTDPDAAPRHRGISCLIIEKGMPGFAVGRHLKKLGYRGVRSGELVFQDCRVPAENLIGVEGKGFNYIMAGLEVGRINVAARGVGLARAAFEDSIKYAQQRVQFGVPICQHQTIQNKLADMATRVEAARMLVYQAAAKKDRGERCDLEAGMAKLFASETSEFCASEAIQIHGGYGYIEEFNVERYFRDCKLLTVGEGTNEIQRLVIARRLLQKYAV